MQARSQVDWGASSDAWMKTTAIRRLQERRPAITTTMAMETAMAERRTSNSKASPAPSGPGLGLGQDQGQDQWIGFRINKKGTNGGGEVKGMGGLEDHPQGGMVLVKEGTLNAEEKERAAGKETKKECIFKEIKTVV